MERKIYWWFGIFYVSLELLTKKLFPMTENPFVFYDENLDGFADVALRLSTNVNIDNKGINIHSMRLSFDIDHDASIDSPCDYGFSLTAIGNIDINRLSKRKLYLRSIVTEPIYDSRNVMVIFWTRTGMPCN